MAKTKKILECDKKWLNAGNLWNYPIITLSIAEIWKTVSRTDILAGKPFYKPLKESIEVNGMHFPIMVVHTSHKELLQAKDRWGDKLSELPIWHNDINPQSKYHWSVWGGTQRLYVAEDLGYTHISCLHMDSIDRAIAHQKLMRKPYKDTLYNGQL